jgi:hypothetical protein
VTLDAGKSLACIAIIHRRDQIATFKVTPISPASRDRQYGEQNATTLAGPMRSTDT